MSTTKQTLALVLDALAQNFRPEIVRQMNRRSVALKVLRKQAGAGKNVAFDVETDGMTAEVFTDGDDVTAYSPDPVAPAVQTWAHYRANFIVTDLAMAASSSSLTPQGLMGLWSRNMMNAATKLASTMNADVFSGGSTNELIGLDTALDDSTTYYGITRSGSDAWSGNVIDPGSPTAVSLSDIRKDINSTIYSRCGEQPDLALCSPAVFNTLGDLFTELRRYNQPVTSMSNGAELDASVGALSFEGCTFIKDKDATADQIYYLNTNYVYFEYLPQDDATIGQNTELDDGHGPIPLGARFKKLATTGSAEKATLQAFAQLVVERPNACGLRKNVLTS
jgi:hypothetical protein